MRRSKTQGDKGEHTSSLASRGIESFGDGDLDGLVVLLVAFKKFRTASVHGCEV